MDKVIYRKYYDGEIIALFPQIAAGCHSGWECQSYMHVGQHGAATPSIVIKQTKLATPNEYRKLQSELKQIGYNPKPTKRFTQKDLKIRRTQYNLIQKNRTV